MTETMRAGARPWIVEEDAARDVIAAGSRWLQELLDSTGQRRYVIGISGGIDSAVVALWAARAVGAERVTLLAMPYGLMASSIGPPSAVDSLEDAQRVFEAIPGADTRTLDVAPTADLEARALGLVGEKEGDRGLEEPARRLAFGNLKARIRALRLRTIANVERGLVLGTENLSEHMLGYFTIGGDEESDAELITGLFKTEVRAIAGALGVPEAIAKKPPSADLWAGQTDETELGIAYEDADRVLAAGLREGEDGIADEVRERVRRQVEATAYKRADKPAFDPHARVAGEER